VIIVLSYLQNQQAGMAWSEAETAVRAFQFDF
jgi:hypothetical protein